MRRLTSLENQVADLIIDLRKSEHIYEGTLTNKIQRIVEMLEEEYGLEKLRTIKKHNQRYGRKSLFYRDSKDFFNMLLRTRVSNREWKTKVEKLFLSDVKREVFMFIV